MSIFCYLLQPKDLLTPELLRFSHYPPLVNFVLVNSPSCPMWIAHRASPSLSLLALRSSYICTVGFKKDISLNKLYITCQPEKQVHALEIDPTCNGTISPGRLGATSEGSLFRFPEKRSSLIGPGALGLAPGGCSCTWFATISSSRLGASDGEGCVQVLRILGATLLPISNISVLCVHVLQQWTPRYQGFQVFSTRLSITVECACTSLESLQTFIGDVSKN